jgi:serine/threonine protein kinase
MLKKMNTRHQEHIVRFITAFTRGDAAMERSYYLMFEWADGGSLADVWNEHPRPAVTSSLMRQTITQLLGLAEAVDSAHNEEEGGTRHGDLKPENILRFRPTEENLLGTLKIGDWGQARYHHEATILRRERTNTRFFTVLYEAPEQGLDEPLSRQYDIWSIGVIILEHIIWLLYGYEGVQRFKKQVMGSAANQEPCYVLFFDRDGQKQARLSKVVSGWMEHIAKDPSCAEETAMGGLLALVETKLLVVTLPAYKATQVRIGDLSLSTIVEPSFRLLETDDPSVPTLEFATIKNTRATSSDLVRGLEEIHEEEDVEDYWFKEAPPGYQRQGPPVAAIKELQGVEVIDGWIKTGTPR